MNNRLSYYLGKYYGHCVITKENICKIHHIVSDICNLCEYNCLLLNYKLSQDMNEYKFSIYPEPIDIYWKQINDNKIKFGLFRVIPHPSYDHREIIIELLLESRYFLKYHFLQFMEKHRVQSNNIRNLYSEDYLYHTLINIQKVTEKGAVDNNGELVLYEKIDF